MFVLAGRIKIAASAMKFGVPENFLRVLISSAKGRLQNQSKNGGGIILQFNWALVQRKHQILTPICRINNNNRTRMPFCMTSHAQVLIRCRNRRLPGRIKAFRFI